MRQEVRPDDDPNNRREPKKAEKGTVHSCCASLTFEMCWYIRAGRAIVHHHDTCKDAPEARLYVLGEVVARHASSVVQAH